MKILVYDVAAEDGGGLFVLKNFYEEVIKDSEKQGGIFQKKVVKYRKDTENKTDTHKKGASV